MPNPFEHAGRSTAHAIPLKYNLRSLMVRRTTSAMTALGVALVVMILFILFGFVAGLRATFLNANGRDNWFVLSRGVSSEPSSFITLEQYHLIRSRAELAANAHGDPMVSPEIVTSFDPEPDQPLRQSSFTYLRGVYPIAFEVHRGFRLGWGRMPVKGRPEMLAGARLAAKYPNLRPGNQIHFGHHLWKIVGTFTDRGSARESEIWTDLDMLDQEVHFVDGFSELQIIIKPGMGGSFAKALTKDSRLSLDAIPERRFFKMQSKLADQLRALGLVVIVFLGIGAIFGGMNTMYSAVARRASEVGVLRALGFSRGAILLSFILESVLLALAGGIIGELLAVMFASLTGLGSHLMNVEMMIFTFRMAPSAFVAGLVTAVAIGALGGLLPAWRASRLGIVEAIRAT
jgi:putative ABC transport system permease protein